MVKKTTFAPVFLGLVLLLAACSNSATVDTATASSSTATSGSPSEAAPQTQATDLTDVSIESKLGVGILELEGTDLAVTADQANELLLLWKAVKSLNSDDAASDAEIQALYAQIEENLTEDQVQVIRELSLTEEELSALMQQYGQNQMAAEAPSSSSSSSSQMQPPDGGGGGPGGGGDMAMGGGGDAMAGGGIDMGAQASTDQEQQAAPTTNNTMDMNLMFADAIINLLQQRVAA